MSAPELAKLAHVGESTVRNFENGRSVPGHNNMAAMVTALRSRGVEIIAEGAALPAGGAGVRFVQE